MTCVEEYTKRITEYYLHKRGEGLILSPKNWMIIEKWEKIYLPSRDFGFLIMSTPKGIMTHLDAKENNTGGRLLAYIY